MASISNEQVEALLQERRSARETGDFKKSDSVRHFLLQQGIFVEDGKDLSSPSWQRVSMTHAAQGCRQWMRRKSDFCSQEVPPSSSYFCVAHQDCNKGRIPCPLDPKHSVQLAKLAGHLRVCQYSQGDQVESSRSLPTDNELAPHMPIQSSASDDVQCLRELSGLARRALTALWDCQAIECGDDASLAEAEFDISTILRIAFPVEVESPDPATRAPWGSKSPRLRPRPLEVIVPRSCEDDVLAAPPSGKRRVKNGQNHVRQQASIAGHLERAGWLPLTKQVQVDKLSSASQNLCLVEFGAGSARLSSMIARVSAEPIALHVLVDRQAVRRTADQALCSDGLDKGEISPLVRRVQCDICELNLTSILNDGLAEGVGSSSVQTTQDIHSQTSAIVCIGKHVCGSATDLTLRCCIRAFIEGTFDIRGMALALCCHHLCDWSTYVGQSWFIAHGLSAEDFERMRWYSKLAHSQYKQRPDGVVGDLRSQAARTAAARAELGHVSKRVIDEGRLAWLRDQGWSSRVVRFVQREVSPENSLLLAEPPRDQDRSQQRPDNNDGEASAAKNGNLRKRPRLDLLTQ